MVEAPPLRNIRDGYVSQKVPTGLFHTKARLKVAASGAGNQTFSYLFWGKGFPSGASIDQYDLVLHNAGVWTGSVTLTVEPLLKKIQWNKLNYQNRPGVTGDPISISKSNTPNATPWVFNLRALAQQVSQGMVWNGVRLSATGTAVKSLHSAQSEQADLRPYVLLSWSEAPEAPDVLWPDNGLAVSVSKPTLTFDFTDNLGDTTMAALQVKIGSVNNFNSATWDSGEVPSAIPQLDLSRTDLPGGAFSGVANGATVYWWVRVKDASGLWSPWSREPDEGAFFRRVDNGSLNVLSPAAGGLVNRIASSRPSAGVVTGWTGLGSDGSVTQSPAYSENVLIAANSKVTVLTKVTNRHTLPVTFTVQAASTTSGSFGSASLSTPAPASVTLASGETKVIRQKVTTGTPTANGYRLTLTVTSPDYGIGGLVVEEALAINQWYEGPHFDGSIAVVEDTTPPFAWDFTPPAGAEQAAYRVLVVDPDQPASPTPFWDSNKITGTEETITPPKRIIGDLNKLYRAQFEVWDTVDRIKEGNRTIPVTVTRDFVYQYTTSITHVSNLVADTTDPYPWVDLTWTLPYTPDEYMIVMDGNVVVESNIPGPDLILQGTTYRYRVLTADPRMSHTWTVLPIVNGQTADISTAPRVSAFIRPTGTWLCRLDGSDPIVILKSASSPTPAVDAVSAMMQEIHQPIGGGAPVLITQYLRGFEGRVEGVLSDDVAEGLTARVMKNRLKQFKRQSTQKYLLYSVDEVLRITLYNATYRPRAKSGGRVIYDIQFDFFES